MDGTSDKRPGTLGEVDGGDAGEKKCDCKQKKSKIDSNK
jgi:hypothetical protein